MQVKSNLSTLMGKNRYSIKEVHEKTGLARGTISNLYNDKATRIDYETICRLCALFDCDINALLSFDNANGTSNKELEVIHENPEKPND